MNKTWIFGVLSAVMLLSSCGVVNKSDRNGNGDDASHEKVRQNPILPTPPDAYINPADRSAYILNHVWDDYSVIDSTSFADLDGATEQFLVNLLGLANYAGPATFEASMGNLMRKSTATIQRRVINIMDRYLYDPNSPMRDEDLYAAFMHSVMKSGNASFADSVRYEDRLTMYYKNKPGSMSQDFEFTTYEGRRMTLHSVKAKHLLLFFYNPDCHTCQATEKYISESAFINSCLSDKNLSILFVYPDMEVKDWREKASSMPKPSIVAYNPSQSINNKRLYEIKAMPCLYLLGEDKTVIMRDVTVQQVEAYMHNLLNR